MFYGAWAIAKGFLSEHTREKIVVLGGNFAPSLLEHCDAENLPTFLGGTCTCADSTGDCMTSNKGPWNEYESVKPKGVKRKSLDSTIHLKDGSDCSGDISEGSGPTKPSIFAATNTRSYSCMSEKAPISFKTEKMPRKVDLSMEVKRNSSQLGNSKFVTRTAPMTREFFQSS